ncbi:MAG: fructokinase [Verrucomicrobiota bacterium]|jgi:fructokinase|nr:fructokinase [Verrucomicrobiota bacterium]
MNTEFYTFGEILWDCLPSGRHAGGAPFNVAGHIAQLGVSVSLLSSVGQDALGDEILGLAEQKGVNVEFVDRARIGLPTGTAIATVDALGNATYDLVRPVAWDEIIVSAEALASVAQAGAFVFGSLASRSPYNLEQLDHLLEVKGPLKFFDVNLRPPFADPKRIVELAARADVLKLNHDEVGQMASWIRTGEATPNPPGNPEAVAAACAILSEATNTARICVTMGAEGAALWDRGNLVTAVAPQVIVKDTVGAGDAFMAGLIVGLTRGADKQTVLTTACRLGAIVASHDGAIPVLPPELIQEFRVNLKATK